MKTHLINNLIREDFGKKEIKVDIYYIEMRDKQGEYFRVKRINIKQLQGRYLSRMKITTISMSFIKCIRIENDRVYSTN